VVVGMFVDGATASRADDDIA
jgi:hypothetical protein